MRAEQDAPEVIGGGGCVCHLATGLGCRCAVGDQKCKFIVYSIVDRCISPSLPRTSFLSREDLASIDCAVL